MRVFRAAVLLLAVLLLPLSGAVGQHRVPPAAAYTYQIIGAEGRTYGYEIRKNARPFIRQLTIPGQTGTHGFRSAAQAAAVAQLVVRKLQRSAGMPAVTRAELDSLRVLP